MTTFDRREEAFENMFAHDEEMHFKAEARRAKMLAAWAGGLNGKSGADLDAYAADLVGFVVTNAGDQALFERLRGDLPAALVTDTEIRERIGALMTSALAAVKTA